MNDTVTASPLVLAGAGHAHLVMLRRWLDTGYRPPTGTILVNPGSHAWYSGMMPGLLAGRYNVEECAIALAPLCRALGIELRDDSVVALDAAERRVSLAHSGELIYQCLAINTGSKPPSPVLNDGSMELVPAKPFSTFHQSWLRWQQGAAPEHLGILGGGAAAVELALALRKSLPRSELHVLCANELLSGQAPGLIQAARRLLLARGIKLHEGGFVDQIKNGHVFVGGRPIQQLDALVLASGAAALDWYQHSGLACDDAGFVRVGDTLQAVSAPEVFVAGDSAAHQGSHKSGVYSVRHGAILAKNIRANFTGQSMVNYKPQRSALALLSTADGGALLHYAGWTLSGRLMGKWKNHLDQRFMKRHRVSDH
ncbi:MAG: FAD-dependent oxidoreductase [Pseudohongiella sp.]